MGGLRLGARVALVLSQINHAVNPLASKKNQLVPRENPSLRNPLPLPQSSTYLIASNNNENLQISVTTLVKQLEGLKEPSPGAPEGKLEAYNASIKTLLDTCAEFGAPGLKTDFQRLKETPEKNTNGDINEKNLKDFALRVQKTAAQTFKLESQATAESGGNAPTHTEQLKKCAEQAQTFIFVKKNLEKAKAHFFDPKSDQENAHLEGRTPVQINALRNLFNFVDKKLSLDYTDVFTSMLSKDNKEIDFSPAKYTEKRQAIASLIISAHATGKEEHINWENVGKALGANRAGTQQKPLSLERYKKLVASVTNDLSNAASHGTPIGLETVNFLLNPAPMYVGNDSSTCQAYNKEARLAERLVYGPQVPPARTGSSIPRTPMEAFSAHIAPQVTDIPYLKGFNGEPNNVMASYLTKPKIPDELKPKATPEFSQLRNAALSACIKKVDEFTKTTADKNLTAGIRQKIASLQGVSKIIELINGSKEKMQQYMEWSMNRHFDLVHGFCVDSISKDGLTGLKVSDPSQLGTADIQGDDGKVIVGFLANNALHRTSTAVDTHEERATKIAELDKVFRKVVQSKEGEATPPSDDNRVAINEAKSRMHYLKETSKLLAKAEGEHADHLGVVVGLLELVQQNDFIQLLPSCGERGNSNIKYDGMHTLSQPTILAETVAHLAACLPLIEEASSDSGQQSSQGASDLDKTHLAQVFHNLNAFGKIYEKNIEKYEKGQYFKVEADRPLVVKTGLFSYLLSTQLSKDDAEPTPDASGRKPEAEKPKAIEIGEESFEDDSLPEQNKVSGLTHTLVPEIIVDDEAPASAGQASDNTTANETPKGPPILWGKLENMSEEEFTDADVVSSEAPSVTSVQSGSATKGGQVRGSARADSVKDDDNEEVTC